MTSGWEPYREPLRVTVMRTGAIALAIGAALALPRGGVARLPMWTLLALWPAFGGHWVEIWFLNWLRPRLPAGRAVQAGARIAVWFAGGAVLAIGMSLTARALDSWPERSFGRAALGNLWWIGGLAFIGVELVAHLVLLLRGRPSAYNGRG